MECVVHAGSLLELMESQHCWFFCYTFVTTPSGNVSPSLSSWLVLTGRHIYFYITTTTVTPFLLGPASFLKLYYYIVQDYFSPCVCTGL